MGQISGNNNHEAGVFTDIKQKPNNPCAVLTQLSEGQSLDVVGNIL